MTGTIWPVQPKIFTIWPITEKSLTIPGLELYLVCVCGKSSSPGFTGSCHNSVIGSFQRWPARSPLFDIHALYYPLPLNVGWLSSFSGQFWESSNIFPISSYYLRKPESSPIVNYWEPQQIYINIIAIHSKDRKQRCKKSVKKFKANRFLPLTSLCTSLLFHN